MVLEATDGKKLFKLFILFYKPIIAEDSKYEMASVGRMTFTFKKESHPSKWNQLLDTKALKVSGKKGPTNMHKWFQMQEKYDTELDKLDDDDDEDDAKNNKKSKAKSAATTKATESKTTTTSKNDENQDDDDNDDEKITSTSTTENQEKSPHNEKIELINKEMKEKIKVLEDLAKKEKDDLDIKWRQDKQNIDKELQLKKKEIQTKAKNEIQALNNVSTSSDNEDIGTGKIEPQVDEL